MSSLPSTPRSSKRSSGPRVEPRADAVEHGGDVLAHRRPVGAAAGEPDLGGRGEEAGLLRADPLHDALRQPALQQLDEGVDAARAAPARAPSSAAGARASPRPGRCRGSTRTPAPSPRPARSAGRRRSRCGRRSARAAGGSSSRCSARGCGTSSGPRTCGRWCAPRSTTGETGCPFFAEPLHLARGLPPPGADGDVGSPAVEGHHLAPRPRPRAGRGRRGRGSRRPSSP